MLTPFDPLDTVLLAEALDVVQAETEAAHVRQQIERTMREIAELVDRLSSEGSSLERIADEVGTRYGIDPAWIVQTAREEVAEIKRMLVAGMDRAAVAETIAARLEVSPGEVIRAVDSAAAELDAETP